MSRPKSPPKPARKAPAKPRKPPAKSKPRERKIPSYSDDFRVNALYAVHLNGGNVNGTAKRLGVPGPTLDRWVKGHRVPHILQMVEDKKGDIVRAITESLWLLMAGLSDADAVFKAPLTQRATAFGILFDKLALLVLDPRRVDPGRTVETSAAESGPVPPDVSRLSYAEQYELFRLLSKASGDDASSDAPVPKELPGVPQSGVPRDGAESEKPPL